MKIGIVITGSGDKMDLYRELLLIAENILDTDVSELAKGGEAEYANLMVTYSEDLETLFKD